MTLKNTQPELVYLYRGGKKIYLRKSEEKFLVKLKKNEDLESFSNELLKGLDKLHATQFLHKYPGDNGAVFHCPSEHCNSLMDQIRQQSDLVEYCSHVLQRSMDSSSQTDEIGLDNKVFVEFNAKPDEELLYSIENKFGLKFEKIHEDLSKCYLFELTSDATINPIKISGRLMSESEYNCKHAEPCLISKRYRRKIPDDGDFPLQWHLRNTGQGLGTPGADCNAEEAWDETWGDPGIKVAIIDNDFDLEHPDLNENGKVVSQYDVVQLDTDPTNITNNDGHGTSCAGIAVASRERGTTVGIAPDCKLMPIRIDEFVSDREEAFAFVHAYAESADVISCSWGIADGYHWSYLDMPEISQQVVKLCAIDGRNGKGIPIFFAGGNGNESSELDGYASNPNVIAIAASTNNNRKAAYSDYGENIWVCAPSSGGTLKVTTIDRTGPKGRDVTDYTTEFGGTSAAAPLVAGLAALMLSVNKELTCEQIKQILRDTSIPIGEDSPTWYIDNWDNDYTDAYDATGHSKVFGYGRIDAGAAVRRAATEPVVR